MRRRRGASDREEAGGEGVAVLRQLQQVHQVDPAAVPVHGPRPQLLPAPLHRPPSPPGRTNRLAGRLSKRLRNCESLHTPYLSPYLKVLGADFSNNVNFAIGGSTATPAGLPSRSTCSSSVPLFQGQIHGDDQPRICS